MVQRQQATVALAGALAMAAWCGKAAENQATMAQNQSVVGTRAPAATSALPLPDSPTAVAMPRPSLPAFAVGDCPGPDPCEFGKTWDVCEAVPVLREGRDGAAILRQLKPNESFIAESGRIELVAPGKIRVFETTDPKQTGGIAIAKNTIIETYGPLQASRALYFDPNSGKGWMPPAASFEPWLTEAKIAALVEAPKMTWWVKVKLNGGETGWLQLKSDGATDNFPVYDSAAVVRSWDINLTRDDETPGCAGLLEMREEQAKSN